MFDFGDASSAQTIVGCGRAEPVRKDTADSNWVAGAAGLFRRTDSPTSCSSDQSRLTST